MERVRGSALYTWMCVKPCAEDHRGRSYYTAAPAECEDGTFVCAQMWGFDDMCEQDDAEESARQCALHGERRYKYRNIRDPRLCWSEQENAWVREDVAESYLDSDLDPARGWTQTGGEVVDA